MLSSPATSFLLQNDPEITIAGPTTRSLWYVMVSQVVKAEVLVGISFGITDYMGTYDIPENQGLLADAILITEGLREVVVAAERQDIF